jgi:SAM-dependent methyltransferase
MHAPDHDESPRDYVLGHSDRELDRLRMQASFINPITRRFFVDAGIGSGMHVLDVGTGAGDVAFLAAELVGDKGDVVGVDRSAAALEAARARADALAIRNVSFREGDPSEITFEQQFDAVVGRYVLQFQTDPGAMLRSLARHVGSGGLVVFHEVDWGGARSIPPCPTYDECCQMIVKTFQLLGTESRLGLRLHSTFLAAGLPAPTMRLDSTVGGGTNSSGPAILVARLAGTLLPDMERLGVATAADLGLETLADRIVSEAVANGSVLVTWFDVAAWCRV